MHAEAGHFILEVDEVHLAVLVGGGVVVELDAPALQEEHGALDAVGADGDVAVPAALYGFQHFESGAGEEAALAFLDEKAREFGIIKE